MNDRKRITKYALSLEKTGADMPFEEDFDTTVLRHTDTGKWFGLIMNIPFSRLGIEKNGNTDVLNIKIAQEDSFILRELYRGVIPAYHMNKIHWVSVILDYGVPISLVENLIDKSYEMTAKRKRK